MSNYNPNIGLTTTPDYQRYLDDAGRYPDADGTGCFYCTAAGPAHLDGCPNDGKTYPEDALDDICAFCGEPLPPGTERDICWQCDARARERDAAIREDLWHTHRKGGL